MNMDFTNAISRLDRLLDWFIPANVAAHRDTKQRARMFLLSHLFGPILGNVLPLYLLLAGFERDYRLFVFFGAITAFWIFPFILKWTGRYVPLAICSIQNLIFVILWACYSYGGVHSPFLSWFVAVPLLAFFYLSPGGSLKYWIVGMIAANVVAFFTPMLLGMEYPPADLDALQGPGILSMLSASAYVAMMAFYYAAILASQLDLEHEVKRHMETADELRRTATAARRSGAAKSEFVAKMSHELRTPLNAVIGYSQILLEDAQDDDDQMIVGDLEKIQDSGEHLLRLVNDILDFSKIEAGKMEVLPFEIELAPRIEETIESRRDELEKRGLTCHFDPSPDLGCVSVDWSLAVKAVSNILDNAIKFTENGGIFISADREAEFFTIQVRDTGVGIPSSNQANLFDAFSVAGDVSASKYGGAGMGLALSARICRLLNGNIQVESREGEGSTFTVRLPLAPTGEVLAA